MHQIRRKYWTEDRHKENAAKPDPNDEKRWSVYRAYLRENSLVDHHIRSYNDFIQRKLRQIITSPSIDYTHPTTGVPYRLDFHNLKVSSSPTHQENNTIRTRLRPQTCRLRNLDYMCSVTVDVHRTPKESGGEYYQQPAEVFADVNIGQIPCMVRSQNCPLSQMTKEELIDKGEDPNDPGGYFIIRGSEKVLMSVDRLAHNLFVFKKKPEKLKTGGVFSGKSKSHEFRWRAEVQSHSETNDQNLTKTVLMLSERNLAKCEEPRLFFTLPQIKEPVPYPDLMLALGIKVEDIPKLVIPETDDPVKIEENKKILKLLIPSISNPEWKTSREARTYLSNYVNETHGNRKYEYFVEILKTKLLQDIPTVEEKRYFLAFMTYRLLQTVIGVRKPDDRDHYRNKRVNASGSVLSHFIKSAWKRIVKDVKKTLDTKNVDIREIFVQKQFTSDLRKAFNTGNFASGKQQKTAKMGLSQMLKNTNRYEQMSYLRRVVTPADTNNTLTEPRYLHDSQFGFLCPCETPEGKTGTGLTKHLSLLSTTTLTVPNEIIVDLLRSKSFCRYVFPIGKNSQGNWRSDSKIFINGIPRFLTARAKAVAEKLRRKRAEGVIPYEVSISMNAASDLYIFTDEGRLIIPVLRVENGKTMMDSFDENLSWQDLLERRFVEYLDPAEMECCLLAADHSGITENHTHCLIHASLILGFSASTIPFPNHNQGPRNIFQSAMGKQAIGIYALNYKERFDTDAHVLVYPQLPISETRAMKELGSAEYPTGINCVVALMSYSGYNQEDSVLVNKSAIERGLFRSVKYTSKTETNKKKGNTSEIVQRPDPTVDRRWPAGYQKLDDDGLPSVDTPLQKNDVVIGKVKQSGQSRNDASARVSKNGLNISSVTQYETENSDFGYRVTENGYSSVDRVIISTDGNGAQISKVRVRQDRVPQQGDKLASRAAQKGVIGRIVPQEDLPFTADGIVPDIIMNPNALPSRMTIGQLIECLQGKVGALSGEFQDCSPFNSYFSIEELGDKLAELGLQRHGDERMMNGMTGELMEASVFIGVVYYQRLRHMVVDKIHARNHQGRRETLTQQASEGRRRDGGLRFGEMEQQCMISHGASFFLRDRLLHNADKYEMYVCNDCSNDAVARADKNEYECMFCKHQDPKKFSKIVIPYVAKLLRHELNATGIGVWWELSDKVEETVERNSGLKRSQMKTVPILYRYEFARMRSERAQQLSDGEPAVIDTTETDPIKIAHMEIFARKCPIMVERTLPNGDVERVPLSRMVHIQSEENYEE